MKITFDITHTDGTTARVTTAFADVIALEDQYDIDASTLSVRQRAGWMAYLAWHASKRTGQATEPFDTWKAHVEALDVIDDAGKAE
jgi:hypothetical protein